MTLISLLSGNEVFFTVAWINNFDIEQKVLNDRSYVFTLNCNFVVTYLAEEVRMLRFMFMLQLYWEH